MGGLPIWTTVKPMVDLLASVRYSPKPSAPWFLAVKGGMAYRQWEMERQTINNLSQIAGEIQLGAGVYVTRGASLSLVYQGIYGGSIDFQVTPADAFNGTGHVSNIPVQNGLLLNLNILL